MGAGTNYALRLLSDGGALVANNQDVLRLDSSGAIVKTYTVGTPTPGLFALNLDPDGTTFWTGSNDSVGTVYHIRISDGSVLGQFNINTASHGGILLGGLTVFGEITQGCPSCEGGTTGGGGTAVPEPSTFILLASGLLGSALYVRLRSIKLAFHERILPTGKVVSLI